MLVLNRYTDSINMLLTQSFLIFLKRVYFIASDSSAPALNLATFFAGILIGALVEGLIPVLAALSDTANVPKPTKATLLPLLKLW